MTTNTSFSQNPNDEPTFEVALKDLEEIVEKMESGQVPLEEAVALYERGIKLKALCKDKLDKARLRIEKVTADHDGQLVKTEPFELERQSVAEKL
jgi:exodeoxyribonuclease VII small subunit